MSFATLQCKEGEKMFNPESVKLTLYPNPNNGVFIVELNIGEANTDPVDIQVLNMLGQAVYMDRTAAIDGKIMKEVKISEEMPSGNYLVRVKCGDQMYTGRIVYQK
jgi:hypothetical protein